MTKPTENARRAEEAQVLAELETAFAHFDAADARRNRRSGPGPLARWARRAAELSSKVVRGTKRG